jgi:hypothetical protein
MQHHACFTRLELDNRLGQKVFLGVTHIPTELRDYVFVTALSQQASSFVGKNADHFAFQLLHRFQLDTKRFELVELRSAAEEQSLWRWRFEWVGTTPLSGRGELVTSPVQRQQLMRLLDPHDQLKAAAT